MPSDQPQQPSARSEMQRRLATILAADVAGYSRMMGENEEATVHTLRGHREVFDALLKQHNGRVFNTAGDAILAEFPSAVDAVRCATEIQAVLHTRNARLPEGRKMLFRMGINLGDVVVQGTDLLGDGVNVAARIQTVAEPGGICISGSVYDQILNKLTLQFSSLGDQSFKNIARPVRTFTVTHGEVGAPLPVKAPPAGKPKSRAIVMIGAILIVAVAASYWQYVTNAKRPPLQTSQTATPAAPAAPAVAGPEAEAAPPAPVVIAPPPESKTAAAFDGTYKGEICNFPNNADKKRCWDIALKVRNGTATETWQGRPRDKPSTAHVTIGPQGVVTISLDGWKVSGEPLAASLSGRVKDDGIDARGQWANGIHADGHWTRAR